MNIQFAHVRNYYEYLVATDEEEDVYIKEREMSPFGGKTVAMVSMQPWFFNELVEGNTFETKIGVAVCSEEDNYNKSTGRQLALERMKTVTLRVMSKVIEEDEVILNLEDVNGNKIVLRRYKLGNKVHLIGYN